MFARCVPGKLTPGRAGRAWPLLLAVLLGIAALAAWARQSPRAALTIGDQWLSLGEVSRAEGAYGRFLAQRGNAPDDLFQIGARFLQAQQWRKAEHYLSRAVAADPVHPARVLLGIAYEKTGRDEQAEATYREALRRRPGDPQALNALGYFYAYRGYRIGLAVELLQRALQLAPEEGAIIDSLGWALYQRGDLTAAIRQLRRAVAALPGDAEVRFHFGVALARAGLRDPALVELGKAARQDPKLPGVQAALRQVRAGRRLPVPLVPPGVRRPSAPDDDAEDVRPPAQPREAPLSPPRLPRGRTT